MEILSHFKWVNVKIIYIYIYIYIIENKKDSDVVADVTHLNCSIPINTILQFLGIKYNI